MAAPSHVPTILFAQIPANGHPGLQYLSTLDHLLIDDHKVKKCAEFTGYEKYKKYKIRDNQGRNVYFAVEENKFWDKFWGRKIDTKILDCFQNEIVHVSRHSSQEVKIYSPPGRLIGTVKYRSASCCSSGGVEVKNENGHIVFRIKHGRKGLKIFSSDDTTTKVGMVSKQRCDFSKHKLLGISFPLELDVCMKAVLMGGCFLLDEIYFTERPSRDNPFDSSTFPVPSA